MNAPQGSAAWLASRAGCATASRFADILAKGQGKTRSKYLRQVVTERLIGKPIESLAYGSWSAHLERGHTQEPLGLLAYEAMTGEPVELVGFIEHPSIAFCGCSPDGLLNDDGGLEVKCVIPTIQVETILAGGYPPEHKAQIMGNLAVTGRDYWDFGSYSHDMPEHLRLYVVRVQRDEEYIAMLEREVIKFLREVDAMVERLMRMRMPLTEAINASLGLPA